MTFPSTKQLIPFTILLVDDRPENLLVLEELLDNGSRQFIKATSGNEALKQALKNDQIGLIMLDVQMPDMDGFEVAKFLKTNQKTRDISIIFVTAISKDEQYVMKGFEEGAVDYLSKPLDSNITKAKVNVFEQLWLYQQALKRSATELAIINKQLEKFVYIVAHDLKSPLTGLISLLHMVEGMNESQPISQQDLAHYLADLKDAGYHLSSMISTILEYSRQSADQQASEVINVSELLTQTIHLLFPPKHIQINIIEPMPLLFTKKVKLQQVFQNLLSNAIKYNDKAQGRIDIGCTEKGDSVEFYVRDNGPGMTSEQQTKLFRLFQPSGHSQRESSTGIGLNILKMLVEEQGGALKVVTAPGEGCTVLFNWRKR
ncbi:hybrid sensor histidine kinase/response regulator [Spirosoma radiotolerans]|uniref:histidine kinase n=1 Tax=Spirosoma radiotolerans TaxID=1379870 RepID=A0A0E3ZWS0_9BACT|nr:hybrid sensor histidine kinase/response regulator [Spirosoma radiotolerans]AKD56528.1 histidine kinase [Spirosoma radiotolerans]